MLRPVSIRSRLVLDLSVTIGLLTIGILTVLVIGSRRGIERLSALVIDRTVAEVSGRVRGFFDDVALELGEIEAQAAAGDLDAAGQPGMLRAMAVRMDRITAASGILVADAEGRSVRVQRDAGGGLAARTGSIAADGGIRMTRRAVEARTVGPASDDPDRFDPRTRPWYTEAMDLLRRGSTGVHWTEPYTFHLTGKPGITVSSAVDGPSGSVVVAIDILLESISSFTTAIHLGDGGGALLMTHDGRVVGLPWDPAFADPASWEARLLRGADEIGLDVARDARAAIIAAKSAGPVRFTSGGEAWWGVLQPLILEGDGRFQVAVALPERELLGPQREIRLATAAVIGAVLVLSVLRALLVARRFSRPIESLAEESDRISHGDLEPRSRPDTSVLELQRLGRAHDRMRDGLRQLLKLERDLQVARQIQQESFPRRLPEPPGYVLSAWNEPADATGGDGYDVIPRTPPQARGTGGDGPTGFLVALADATGHGIGPALAVAQLHAMLRIAFEAGAPIESIAVDINRLLADRLPEGRFITAWMGELDTVAHRITSIAAGQGPILAYVSARSAVDVHPADTIPLGVMHELPDASTTVLPMAPGDIVLVCSDGVFEARDGQGAMFGIERTCEILRRAAGEPGQVIAALRTALDAFTGSRPAEDDRTVIMVARRMAWSSETLRPASAGGLKRPPATPLADG
ncbi:MAG: SpoIIE family protein phosphatase [Phycisphaeraceae bacterium]|nr:SpoIIE family protein phosphatase [Phycisphaeraceae bacterium]